MAYTPHVLVAFGGSWTDEPSEMWENTVRLLANGGGGDTLDPEAYLTAIATNLKTWFSAAGTSMSSRATLNYVKVNHIGADGTYVDKTTTHLRDYSPVVPGGATQNMAGFISLAYTWETALLRGPGHRGRIYPPNATAPLLTALRTTTGARDAIATAGAGLLAVLKNTPGSAGTHATPIVASKVGGQVTPITGCTCDDIYDVQRRRKNRVKGTRSGVIAFA